MFFKKEKDEQEENEVILTPAKKIGVLVHFTPVAIYVYFSNKSFSTTMHSSSIHMTNENEDYFMISGTFVTFEVKESEVDLYLSDKYKLDEFNVPLIKVDGIFESY